MPEANAVQPTPESEELPPLLWVQTILFVSTFLIAAIGVPWYAIAVGFEWSAWLAFFLFCGATGISITAGYHRLWAHNAYKAHWSLRLAFALFGAATVENSILRWVTGHRRHHRHVDDNEKDPYSANRGLWFSHMGWMLRDYPSGIEDLSNVPDLTRDPIVMWQDKHYLAITLTMNFGPVILVSWITGDWLANFLLMGFARLVVTHHATFFINSLAHFWGRKPFQNDCTARDNGLLALVTFGEGYHNYHHRFQTDYRNGVRWFDFDPTKWLIAAAAKVGLASDLKTVERFRIREAQVAAKLELAQRKLAHTEDADRWQAVLEQEYEHFVSCLDEWKTLQQRNYDDIKDSARSHIRQLERELKDQLRRLTALNLEMSPAAYGS